MMTLTSSWFHLPLVLTIAFLAANWSVHPCVKEVNTFTATLTDQQKQVYDAVAAERMTLANNALMQGVFLALLYCLYTLTMICPLRRKGWYYYFSDITCIILSTLFLSYKIAPKKRNMIIEANLTPEEAVEYARIYMCFDTHFWSYFTVALLITIFVLMLLDAMTPPLAVAVALEPSSTTTTTKTTRSKSRQPTKKKTSSKRKNK